MFSNILCVFRPVCSGLPDSPQQPAPQPVCRSHLLSHGISEVCSQTTYTGAAGTVAVCVCVYDTPSISFLITHPYLFFLNRRLCFQGFSFLWRYVELRGECQESMYNLGRALHQMGLTHLAIHYYQKALTLPAQKLEVGKLTTPHIRPVSVFGSSACCFIITLNLETSHHFFRTSINGPTSKILSLAIFSADNSSVDLNNSSFVRSFPPFVYLCLHPSSLQGIADDQVDLKREIAFNLSLIYQASGNLEMARQLINTHCII